MFRELLGLFSINFHATESSPFVSVDDGFVKREKKRVKIAKNALKLLALLVASIVITALGVAILFDSSIKSAFVILAVFDILLGVSGIGYFSFFLEDAVTDLQKLTRYHLNL